MKLTRSTILNIMLIAILAASVCFMNTTANTGYETRSAGYDPWIDLNDDGSIDLFDAIMLLKIYGTKGTAFAGKASLTYDSGWVDITDKCGQYFNITHNLNSTDIIVDITGKTTTDGGPHQRNIGGTGYTQDCNRIYGGTDADVLLSMIQTGDGGYALAGYTESFGAGSPDFW